MGNYRSPQNLFRTVAAQKKRDYITPEDVGEALKRYPLNRVRRDLLAVIGRQVELGLEDCVLCAFLAWKGGRTV